MDWGYLQLDRQIFDNSLACTLLSALTKYFLMVHCYVRVYPIQIVTSLLYQSLNSALVWGYTVYLQEGSLADIALKER